MTDTLIQTLTTERLQNLLQGMGYRVTTSEQNGIVQLLSATQGIGFAVRPGNPGPQAGECVDYTLSCALRVEGELPAGLEQTWNVTKRFARLSRQGPFLVLEMDVIVAGGVSENYLRATSELWDRVLQEFVLFLRNYAQQASATAGAGGAAVVANEAVNAADEKGMRATADIAETAADADSAAAIDTAVAEDLAADKSRKNVEVANV